MSSHTSNTSNREPAWRWVPPLALIAWLGSLVRSGFSYDDREAIFANPLVRGDLRLGAAFTQDYWHHVGDAGHWRPLASLTLRWDYAWFGQAAVGYHLTNVLLHLAVVLLAVHVARRVWPATGRGVALGLAAFAVHPALADSVAWISGRTSMLAALGGLAGLAGVLRAGPRAGWVGLAAGAGLLLALAGKEDGLAFAPALWFVALRSGRRAGRAALVGLALASLVWLGARGQALGAALPTAPEAPQATAGWLARAALGGRALAEGLRLVVAPAGYPPGWRFAALAPSGALEYALSALSWGGLLLVTLVAGLRFIRGGGATPGATLCAVAAILPHLQLIPLAEALAPRFLYLPLLFGAALIGAGLARLPRSLLPLLALTAIGLAWQRAGVYASRESYWRARLPFENEQPMVWNALGNARLESGDPDGARAAWLEAVRRDPSYSRPHVGLARLELEAGDVLAAEEHLRLAVAAGRANPLAWAGLGALYLRTEAFEESASAYLQATRLAPGRAALWRGLARAQLGAGDAAAARESVGRALALDPGDGAAQRLLQTLEASGR